MRIRWLGHSCFQLENEAGLAIIADPYDKQTGYTFPKVRADVVTVSHGHHDHNWVQAVPGHPVVLKGPGVHTLKGPDPRKTAGVVIRGTDSFHDANCGALRGKNTIFCFTLDGIRVVHLGDLGHLLSPEQVQEIGQVDILMIPVGGIYTIDGAGAVKVARQLGPKVAIPMHYRTKALSFQLGAAEEFLKGMGAVERVSRHTLEIAPGQLNQILGTRTVVLEYS